jgi:thiamine-phosphate pyrophosphorylase
MAHSTPSSWSGSSNGKRKVEFPRLYPILDAGLLLEAGLSMQAFARELADAGIRFLQYRDKDAPDALVLERAAMLRAIFPDSCLILNDRVHLAAGCDGVHIGQEDCSPVEARALLGSDVVIGLSTHGERQLIQARESPVDYLAIGPVFATQSKQVPDPVVGLEGVRIARRLTGKPLVAIGGISRSNCASVIDAGADSVAVISDLIPRRGESVGKIVEEFLRALLL